MSPTLRALLATLLSWLDPLAGLGLFLCGDDDEEEEERRPPPKHHR